ncbi:MAG: RNA methyltransferase, partial [Nitrospirota bacterium]
MPAWKDNVRFVLVEPREPGNIGASARAVKNMGFKNLALVNPAPLTGEEQWFAHNAEEVLQRAPRHTGLADAIKDASLVVAVARRTGRRRGMILPLDEAVQRLYEEAKSHTVALLFGREDRGLYNREVDECGLLLTIPSNKEHPSLNLSHAVAVVAYELSRAEFRTGSAAAGPPGPQAARRYRVKHGELDALYQRIANVLALLDYLPRGDRDIEQHIMQNLKHFIGRAG